MRVSIERLSMKTYPLDCRLQDQLAEGADVEGFLDNERERYRAQVERYRRLFVNSRGVPARRTVLSLLNGWREVAEDATTNSAVMR